MKGRVIVLDQPKERGSAAALMVDGRLEDLILDPPKGSVLPSSGDICVVRVTRKLPKAGAFCEMAGGQEGYLREAKSVREGERILVQVVSLPEPGKAVTLSTRLLFKGPRLILTPGAPGVNVSRKIGNESERERLIAAVEAAIAECAPSPEAPDLAENLGVIVRSAARNEDAINLGREFDWLFKWLRIRLNEARDADYLHNDSGGNPLVHALREWVFPRPDAIVCPQGLASALTDVRDPKRPIIFQGDEGFLPLARPEPDPFEAAGLHDAIEALKSPDVPLGAGASMVIEPTRALVAVDVNTGADFSPAAGLKANLAAARDLPRQLRLRGLGGQIAVDFAPMPKQHRRTLEEALRKAFRDDPVETSLVGWTALGLYELQRKRERRPLAEVL